MYGSLSFSCVRMHICGGVQGCPVGDRDRENKSLGRMQQPLLSSLPSSCEDTTPTAAATVVGEDLALPLLGAEAGGKSTGGKHAVASSSAVCSICDLGNWFLVHPIIHSHFSSASLPFLLVFTLYILHFGLQPNISVSQTCLCVRLPPMHSLKQWYRADQIIESITALLSHVVSSNLAHRIKKMKQNSSGVIIM